MSLVGAACCFVPYLDAFVSFGGGTASPASGSASSAGGGSGGLALSAELRWLPSRVRGRENVVVGGDHLGPRDAREFRPLLPGEPAGRAGRERAFPAPRFGHTMTLLRDGRRLCVYGGQTLLRSSQNSRPRLVTLDDVWVFDCATLEWTMCVHAVANHGDQQQQQADNNHTSRQQTIINYHASKCKYTSRYVTLRHVT